MISIRKGILVATLATAALVVAACSSSSNGATSGSNPSSGSPSASGGANKCTGADHPSCTQAEVDTYEQCVMNACDAEMKQCFGSGYRSGSYGGPCGSWLTCSAKCACNDNACEQKCQPENACMDCIAGTSKCTESAKCTRPACMTGGGSKSDAGSTQDASAYEAACADLMTCCDALTDAAAQDVCYKQAIDNPAGCAQKKVDYQKAGMCP